MRRALVWSSIVLLSALAGCGGAPTHVDGDLQDAGSDASAHDAFVAADAFVATDAFTAPDAGASDASTDAAADLDAGVPLGYAEPLPSRGGPVLAHPSFATLTYADDTNRTTLEAYGDAMASDPWWGPTTAEYGVGALTSLGHVRLTDRAPTAATQAQIESYLLGLAAAGTLPRAADGTYDGVVYLLYFPAGAAITLSDGAAACSGWHGVHGEAGSGAMHIAYALAIDCGPGRGFDALGYLEAAASHELVEAVTDPYVSSAPAYQASRTTIDRWSIYGELTDRCVGRYVVRPSGFIFARSWSNAASTAGDDPCPPAEPGEIFYGVSTPSTDVHGAAGATLDLPITGFARGTVPDFPVQAYVAAGPNVRPSLGRTSLNDGMSTNLRLTLPTGTPSGQRAWVVLLIGPASNDVRNFPILVRFD
jgi:hypothetical protein